MSIGMAINYGYDKTCEICDTVSKIFTIALVGVIAFSESAGKARAASELSRMGYHKEAKALMLDD
jgi:hypothetical protein|tara:strand:+ start:190 stop:384 length:195 start_codon:yes stop_codon:yes gene_type:complete